jgi:hypothetical protein
MAIGCGGGDDLAQDGVGDGLLEVAEDALAAKDQFLLGRRFPRHDDHGHGRLGSSEAADESGGADLARPRPDEDGGRRDPGGGEGLGGRGRPFDADPLGADDPPERRRQVAVRVYHQKPSHEAFLA